MKPQQLDEGGSAALRSPERHLAVNARRSLGQCLKTVLARKLEMDVTKLTRLRAAMAISSMACQSIMLLVLATVHAHAQIVGEAETRKFVSCRTLVTWTGPQGTQVSYLGAGNKAYLWAPGNDTVLSGTWRVDPNATSPQSRLAYVAVCAQYGGSAQWDCRPAEILERITMDHADGDLGFVG